MDIEKVADKVAHSIISGSLRKKDFAEAISQYLREEMSSSDYQTVNTPDFVDDLSRSQELSKLIKYIESKK